MDMANYALAWHLAERGHSVHLVAHRVAPELAAHRNVVLHRVPMIGGTYVLSEPLINAVGRRWARYVSARHGRVLVNGGNCVWGDVNWVHYVHAAYRAPVNGSIWRRLKSRCSRRRALHTEAIALRQAKIVIANSRVTERHLVERVGIPQKVIRTVYYGIDEQRFRPVTAAERRAARAELGLRAETMIAFVGALGDRRKGFDTVFEAWRALSADSGWDGHLLVIGVGAELRYWKVRAAECRLDGRIHFLGFRDDVHRVLSAVDALVSPVRYEAYGLGVHEALCCALPAFVTRSAGVAERYPAELGEFLLDDPDDAAELAAKLRSWRQRKDSCRKQLEELSQRMRERTWTRMAREIEELAEERL
jgi:glycosyltransferase involved in cell wall biosynthesis